MSDKTFLPVSVRTIRAKINYYEKMKKEELEVSSDSEMNTETRVKAFERALHYEKMMHKYEDML